MTGVFVNKQYARDIIIDLMVHYGDMDATELLINLKEWNEELSKNWQIGFFMDKSAELFTWVEKIQNNGLLGFQITIDRDLFSCRLDNPNRPDSFNLRPVEIMNMNEVEMEMQGENYFSFSTINYALDNTDKTYLSSVDLTMREFVIDQYLFEREYTNDSFLIWSEDVVRKGKAIVENYSIIRPILRNIKLDGLHEGDIKLYSTGWIDFRQKIPRQMRLINRFMKDRKFAGRIRVKVIGYARDIKEDTVTIDVVQCDALDSLQDLYPYIPPEEGEDPLKPPVVNPPAEPKPKEYLLQANKYQILFAFMGKGLYVKVIPPDDGDGG
jgi:hypothetical protein